MITSLFSLLSSFLRFSLLSCYRDLDITREAACDAQLSTFYIIVSLELRSCGRYLKSTPLGQPRWSTSKLLSVQLFFIKNLLIVSDKFWHQLHNLLSVSVPDFFFQLIPNRCKLPSNKYNAHCPNRREL